MNTLQLYNSLVNHKEIFKPLDINNIKMYVCGPTVYARAHLGNARSVVVYDVLYRVLKNIFPHVNYLRNITDIDDKIINAALEAKVTASEISNKYTDFFHKDMQYLNCLSPSYEPKATDYIKDIIQLIEKLISEKMAYAKGGNVYFSVKAFPQYGKLSGRNLDKQLKAVRIDINQEKENNEDFVLWKIEKTSTDAVYNSPWGIGRPGWHIECSAMTFANFGGSFDIHGGGVDLKFPHHENEIAQVCAAHKESHYAKYWVHNGFLMVDGHKMSKSLGNFITIGELIDQKISGEVIRYAMLMAHYRQPLNWTQDLLNQAANNLAKLTRINYELNPAVGLHEEFWTNLLDDINTPVALMSLQTLANKINKMEDCNEKTVLSSKLGNSLDFIGFNLNNLSRKENDKSDKRIEELLRLRNIARQNRDFIESDRIRTELQKIGFQINDKKNFN